MGDVKVVEGPDGCSGHLTWTFYPVEKQQVFESKQGSVASWVWRLVLQKSQSVTPSQNWHLKIELLQPFTQVIEADIEIALNDKVVRNVHARFAPATADDTACVFAFRFLVNWKYIQALVDGPGCLTVAAGWSNIIVADSGPPLAEDHYSQGWEAEWEADPVFAPAGKVTPFAPVRTEVEHLQFPSIIGTSKVSTRYGWDPCGRFFHEEKASIEAFWRSLSSDMKAMKKLRFSISDLVRARIKLVSFSSRYLLLVKQFFAESIHKTNGYGMVFIPYELFLYAFDMEDGSGDEDEGMIGMVQQPKARMLIRLLNWIRGSALVAAWERHASCVTHVPPSLTQDSAMGVEALVSELQPDAAQAASSASTPGGCQERACARCGLRGSLKCSGCGAISFCSRKCQKAAWKDGAGSGAEYVDPFDAHFRSAQPSRHADLVCAPCSPHFPHKARCPWMKQDAELDHVRSLAFPRVPCRHHKICSYCRFDLGSLWYHPLMCGRCGVSVYCSTICQEEALLNGHVVECDALHELAARLRSLAKLEKTIKKWAPSICTSCGGAAHRHCKQCYICYCSAECQRAHWTVHKTECASKQQSWDALQARLQDEYAALAMSVEGNDFHDHNLSWYLASIQVKDSMDEARVVRSELPTELTALLTLVDFDELCRRQGLDPFERRMGLFTRNSFSMMQ